MCARIAGRFWRRAVDAQSAVETVVAASVATVGQRRRRRACRIGRKLGKDWVRLRYDDERPTAGNANGHRALCAAARGPRRRRARRSRSI